MAHGGHSMAHGGHSMAHGGHSMAHGGHSMARGMEGHQKGVHFEALPQSSARQHATPACKHHPPMHTMHTFTLHTPTPTCLHKHIHAYPDSSTPARAHTHTHTQAQPTPSPACACARMHARTSWMASYWDAPSSIRAWLRATPPELEFGVHMRWSASIRGGKGGTCAWACP